MPLIDLSMDIEILEKCDLKLHLHRWNVTTEKANKKIAEIEEFFTISEYSPSDPIAKKLPKNN